MSPKAKQRLAHICILVRDIDRAIEHFTNILGPTCPDLLKEKVTREERFAGKDSYATAFFRAPGNGCDIQLLQPLDPNSPLYKRLVKHGEGLHHIAFTSSRLETTVKQLKDKGVPLHGEALISDANAPETRWAWVMPEYAQGVLIEVMDEYRPTGG